MTEQVAVALAIEEMIDFFMPRCSDTSTLSQLKAIVADRELWREAHTLCRRIRDKTLRAGEAQDGVLLWQFAFEEICAKTLYNMSLPERPFSSEIPAPFDEDCPFWVLPNALRFARALGVEDPYSVSSALRPEIEP